MSLERTPTVTFDAIDEDDEEEEQEGVARTKSFASMAAVAKASSTFLKTVRSNRQSIHSSARHSVASTSSRATVVFSKNRSSMDSEAGDDFQSEMEWYSKQIQGKSNPPGFFADFVERTRAAERKQFLRKSTSLNSTKSSLGGGFANSRQQPTLGEARKSTVDDPNIVNYQAALQYERMVDDLMFHLIEFHRELEHEAWVPKTVDVLRKKAWEIVESKQKKKVSMSAVINYYTRHKKTHQRSKGLEHQDERRARLTDFLKQYHGSHSKVDLQMPNSDGRLRLVQSDPEAAHMAFTKSLESHQTAALSPVAAPPNVKSPFPKLDSWKIRAARNHGTRSMELSRQISRELSQMSEQSPPTSPFSFAANSFATLKPLSSSPLSSSAPSIGWNSPKHSPSAGGSSTLSGGWGLTRRNGPTPPPLDRESLRADTTLRGMLGHAKEEPRSNTLGSVARSTGQRPLSGKRSLPLSRSAPTLLGQCPSEGSNSSLSPVRQKERSPFVSPWRGSRSGIGTIPTKHSFESPIASQSSVDKYLREAELNYVSPKLIPFITGHSDGLQAKNQALDDTDLLVIGTMLPGKEVITEVDLCGNTLLTEKSLVPFLNKIFGQPVEKLNLNHCLHYAQPPGIKDTLDVVQSLLTDGEGLKYLKILDLGSIAMAVGTHVPICQAIQEHPRLTNVSLADTGMSGVVAMQCIRQLTASTSVEVLDLSWNNFNPEVFIVLGQRLVTTSTLQSLSIANCSSSQSDLDNPVAYFLEYLSRNPRLTHLDISVNRITFRGAMVLEDALEFHSKLSDITVSNNPIGVLGMRCLLRLLARGSSGLIHMKAQGVAGGTIKEAETEKMQLFRPAKTGGRYTLNLSRPYHRALLRMLYKSCDRLCLSPDTAFTNLNYSGGGKYEHPAKDSDGLYSVLDKGKLQFSYMPLASSENKNSPLKGIEDDDFGTFLTRYFDSARLRVGFKKMVPLMAYWSKVEGRVADQLLVLDALCKDFAFTWVQIEQMCKSRPIVSDVLLRMMPTVMGGLPGIFMASRLAINMSEYAKVHKACDALMEFNCENPTGHYKLSLENPSEFCVAERILLLDLWETQINRRLERADASQKGNGSHVRNVKFEENPLRDVYSVVDWSMREWDNFELDYVSSKRPPPGAPVVDQEHWENMLVAAQRAGCSAELQVAAFKKVSHHFYLTVPMLRQLANLFKATQQRLEVFVIFFFRILDIQNEKVARVCFKAEDKPRPFPEKPDVDEVDKLRQRLGYITFFPFIQPEQAIFKFNLTNSDERIALYTLCVIENKERSRVNIRDFELYGGDGNKVNLLVGLPPSWCVSLDKIPTEGSFKCKYSCAPEDRALAERKKFMELYGYWAGPSDDKEIDWWSDITNAPPDVVEFLEFLVTRYENVYDAFTEIDGPDGNGNIIKDEFLKWLEAVKFRKFSGGKKIKRKKDAPYFTPEENKRIDSVFRYLDPSGEGQVSKEEFGVLDQLFKETNHAIREFVWFLARTFENLHDAWEFISKQAPVDTEGDHKEELNPKEFDLASKAVGYYGTTRPIFSYLDKDGEGTVSCDEFQVLANFGRLSNVPEEPASP